MRTQQRRSHPCGRRGCRTPAGSADHHRADGIEQGSALVVTGLTEGQAELAGVGLADAHRSEGDVDLRIGREGQRRAECVVLVHDGSSCPVVERSTTRLGSYANRRVTAADGQYPPKPYRSTHDMQPGDRPRRLRRTRGERSQRAEAIAGLASLLLPLDAAPDLGFVGLPGIAVRSVTGTRVVLGGLGFSLPVGRITREPEQPRLIRRDDSAGHDFVVSMDQAGLRLALSVAVSRSRKASSSASSPPPDGSSPLFGVGTSRPGPRMILKAVCWRLSKADAPAGRRRWCAGLGSWSDSRWPTRP